MISATDLSFFYGLRQSLSDISFAIDAQETVGIFGHNGSGKSTLLKNLQAVLPIGRGKVTFLGRNAIGDDGYFKKELRRNVGVLFQSTSSDDKLSSWHNLMYFARLMGVSNAEKKVHEILKLASIADRAHEAVKKLSGGMRRRLELYRAFLHEPKLLVFDEPTAGLDLREVKIFWDFLSNYQRSNNAAAIISSHNPDELMGCDRILMMKNGAVVKQGSPLEMVSKLDYMRCHIRLKHEARFDHSDMPWFDVIYGEADVVSAKITTSALDNFLRHPLLLSPQFKSFTIENPSLADVYEHC